MQGLFRGALMNALALTLWGCSTTPLAPSEVITRDVTANCPPPVVIIDREFATAPPACVAGLVSFRWADNKWIEALADATGEIKTQSECLRAVSEWIDDERAARKMDVAL
jgi:hypothetical protein